MSGCDDAIVGGGWAGIFFAYRRAVASPNANICIFEASDRIGGRTFSVPPSVTGTEFTLDVGAYRFSPDMHLPGDLIMHHLELPTACYEPGCPSAKTDFKPPLHFNYTAPLRRIVDGVTGLPAGYASAMDEMVARMKRMGVRVHMNATLTDIAAGSSLATRLTFSSGAVVSARTVMLNLPRNKLLALPSLARTVEPRTLRMLRCVKFDAPPSLFHNRSLAAATGLTKAYLFYEDAWWHTTINQTVGEWPADAFNPLPTSEGVYIGVHWNDGPVKCTDVERGGRSFAPAPGVRLGAGVRCRGFLLVYYAATNETFFYGATGAPRQPLGVLGDAPPYDHAKLEAAHRALLQAIEPVLQRAGVEPSALPHPTKLVVGAWSRPGVIKDDDGYTAPTKVYWAPSISGSLANACGVAGLTEDEYRRTVLQPFGTDARVFLANNDWVAQDVNDFFGDWAEESLLQAERALRRLGAPRPGWLNATYYQEKVVERA